VSDVPLAVPVRLELGTNPLVEYVPALEAAATGVVADHQRLAAMPVTVPAAELGSLAVVGDREAARALVRALVCQLATWHAPDDLRLVGWFEPSAEAAWSWMKWLPHARETGTVAGADGRHAAALTVDLGDLDVLLTQLVQPRVEHRARTRAGLAVTMVVNRMPAGGGRLDLDRLGRYLPDARGLVAIPDAPAAADELATGAFTWQHAPARWRRAVRELAANLVADWPRLRLAR
jgi:S-DNA-T family DNA segregation ATPase FtsK/SpoIIIE